MTKPSPFRKCDVEKAVAAVQARGLSIVSVDFLRDGTIRVRTAEGRDLTKLRDTPVNEWDYS